MEVSNTLFENVSFTKNGSKTSYSQIPTIAKQNVMLNLLRRLPNDNMQITFYDVYCELFRLADIISHEKEIIDSHDELIVDCCERSEMLHNAHAKDEFWQRQNLYKLFKHEVDKPKIIKAFAENTICSITHDNMINPVVTNCMHVFERDAINEWLDQDESNKNCPICRTKIDTLHLNNFL